MPRELWTYCRSKFKSSVPTCSYISITFHLNIRIFHIACDLTIGYNFIKMRLL